MHQNRQIQLHYLLSSPSTAQVKNLSRLTHMLHIVLQRDQHFELDSELAGTTMTLPFLVKYRQLFFNSSKMRF